MNREQRHLSRQAAGLLGAATRKKGKGVASTTKTIRALIKKNAAENKKQKDLVKRNSSAVKIFTQDEIAQYSKSLHMA